MTTRHRASPRRGSDYIAVKRFNDAGEVVGESRFRSFVSHLDGLPAPVNEIPQIVNAQPRL